MRQYVYEHTIKNWVWCDETKKVERQKFKTDGTYMRSCDDVWGYTDRKCRGPHYVVNRGEEV